MTLFTNYRKRILRKIAKLENEQADLVRERSRISLSLSPKEYCAFSTRIGDLKMIIDNLTELL
jgi:hypothetical protein